MKNYVYTGSVMTLKYINKKNIQSNLGYPNVVYPKLLGFYEDNRQS